jgi:hypothetical protein
MQANSSTSNFDRGTVVTTHRGSTLNALAALLGTAACLLLLIAGLNYRVDPAAIFDNGLAARENATILTSGQAAALTHVDDRRLHVEVAQLISPTPDTLILGSSRTMLANTQMVSGTLYNASVSSATLPDILGLAEAFVAAGKKPRILVLGADTWLLSGTPINQRWRAIAEEYGAMQARIGEQTKRRTTDRLSRAKTLISLPYTLESLAVLRVDPKAALFARPPLAAIDPARWDGPLKRADGSLRYGVDVRNRATQLVQAAALTDAQQIITEALVAEEPDPAAVDTLSRFARYLEFEGVTLVLLLPPFNPLTYRAASESARPDYLREREQYYRQWAGKLGVRVVGSYDPARAGCGAEEFYDGVHARPSCLARQLVTLDETGARR